LEALFLRKPRLYGRIMDVFVTASDLLLLWKVVFEERKRCPYSAEPP
jgi:hypothetical protein